LVRILKARYRSAQEFLQGYQGSFPTGGLFFPTREHATVGEAVLAEVRFPELGDRLLMRSFVAWRRSARVREGTAAGIGVEFLESERKKRDFLLAVARGEASGCVVARNHRRIPVQLAVAWYVKDERARMSATVLDIGPGGAFLSTPNHRPSGTHVVVEITPPGGAAPLAVEGRVAWARTEPGSEGFGVEFRCRDTGGLRRLKEMCRRLENLDASAA
jgi:Tfp pilus assembly protein PilZ